MAEKYQNKYRIPSARLPGWDYGQNAAYFVTICTKDRECFFGNIVETPCMASQQMQLSEMGRIAETEWLKTPGIRPDMNLELGEFVVMPNHFHGIVIIGGNEYNTQRGGDGNERRDAMHCVSTNDEPSSSNKFGPQSKNLASIIRGYKSAVKKYATMNSINFAWQPRFHDHIIRDNQSFQNISNYIINNPMNWRADQLYR
jgi:putative transposase